MGQTMKDTLGIVPKRSFANPALADLAQLPAYVEPPRVVSQAGRKAGKNSTFVILVVALGAGVCGGVTYRECVSNPFNVEAQAERITAAETPAYTSPVPYIPLKDIPLPTGAQLIQPALPAGPPAAQRHVVASNHAGTDRGPHHPARLTRPSNG